VQEHIKTGTRVTGLQYVFLHVTVHLTSLHFCMTPVTLNCNSAIQQYIVQCRGLGGVTRHDG